MATGVAHGGYRTKSVHFKTQRSRDFIRGASPATISHRRKSEVATPQIGSAVHQKKKRKAQQNETFCTGARHSHRQEIPRCESYSAKGRGQAGFLSQFPLKLFFFLRTVPTGGEPRKARKTQSASLHITQKLATICKGIRQEVSPKQLSDLPIFLLSFFFLHTFSALAVGKRQLEFF